MSDSQPSPIFVRTYDLLLWLVQRTVEFPRSQRGVMARRVQDAAFALHNALVNAGKGVQVVDSLRRADVALTQLRTYVRLCFDLKLFSSGQYEHAARQMAEIGRMLGAWQKKAVGQ